MNDVRDSIGWADYTLSPVIGCIRGCKWCYADRLHTMRHKAKLLGKKLPDQYLHPFNELHFYPERLNDPDLRRNAPCKIFITPQTDPEYWSRSWWVRILDAIDCNPRHTFMFLTKNPDSYACIEHDRWPKNTMQGTTMTCEQNYMTQQDIFLRSIRVPRPFLSIEPLLGTLKIDLGHKYERVIVGAMSGSGAVVPEKCWIESILDNGQIFWKNNITRYL
jgi:protein gp37